MSNNGLPRGWARLPTAEIAEISPPKGGFNVASESLVHFVPMASVSEEFGGIDISATRPLKEVVKGYTAFRAGDVLFAKITPCMENGKIAVVPELEHGIGFGSTEFHVLRPSSAVQPRWLAYYFSQTTVRRSARRSMTGSAGQLRVPTTWLAEQAIPVPPLHEQRRIVAKIDELFSDLDAGVAALERVRANLKRYRAAVLKAAVEGRLTAEWRERHPDVEPASKLLERILTDRRKKWEEDQLAKFTAADKTPPKSWHEKYVEPSAPVTNGLPELPQGWMWAALSQIASVERGKFQHRPRNEPRFYGGSYPFVQIGDLPREGGYITSFKQTLNEEGLGISRLFPNGTVLIAIVGATIANTGILSFDSCTPDSLVAIQSPHQHLSFFIDLYLRSRKLAIRLMGYASGGQPNINLETLMPLPVPLPQVSEVEAIIEEVERRLSIIEESEALIDANLKRAARLRQSILKRAFEGKLVPQDPGDEPASALLERIRAERQPAGDGQSSTKAKRPRKETR